MTNVTHRPDEAPGTPASLAWNGAPGTPEEEIVGGTALYLDVLARIHDRLAPQLYLEIGIRHGASLALARSRAIGIDPAPAIDRELPSTTQVFVQTSDAFFGEPRHHDPAPDFCFIDGLHLVEQVQRDFANIERVAAPGAVVVVDDIFPNHPAQAARSRRTRVWTGDVWRFAIAIDRERPDLFTMKLDAAPAGLLLIAGLDPAFRPERASDPDRASEGDLPERVRTRAGAVDPASRTFDAVLDELAICRQAALSPHQMVTRLRAVRDDPAHADTARG